MKLLLVATYPPDQQHSLTGFAQALHAGLGERGVQVRMIAPRAIAAKLGFRGRTAKWLGHADKVILFPSQLRSALHWADVVHLVDHGLAIYTKYLHNKPHIVTCHDLIAMRAARGDLPEWETAGTSGIFQRMIELGLNRAQHVVCISDATRSDLKRLTQVSPHNTSVIHDALFHLSSSQSIVESRVVLERLGLAPQWPFLLHIGRNVPTKNRKGVLDIFAALSRNGALNNLGQMHLVMAGGPLSPELRAHALALKIDGLLHEMPRMEEHEIQALYSCALALVFPSFYEGFGLPIIEAQAYGCPVFTSDRAPMTEVGGAAARYFDPEQPEQGAAIIAKHIGSVQDRQAMIDEGLNNVLRFSLDRMCEQYIAVYRRVLTERYGEDQ